MNSPDNPEQELLEINHFTLSQYEDSMVNLLQYMIDKSIFNTYVTRVDEDSEFSIILKTKNPSLNDLLGHLSKYIKIKNDDKIVGETCAICCEEYKVDQYKRVLDKCGHCFHKKCVDKWFRKNQGKMNCPVCRTNYNKVIKI